MTLTFDAACRAIKGARPYQEDAAAVWPGTATYSSDMPLPVTPGDGRELVLVLADGMGGHVGGAMASMSACETFLAAMAGLIEGIDVSAEEVTQGLAEPARAQRDRLTAALAASNVAMISAIEMEPSLDGMGTTLVGAEIAGDGLMWISVGDSPLYLCRRGEIEQLNEDHSLAPMLDRMVETGQLSADAARTDPRRHMLRSAVTGEPLELVDLPRQPLVLAADDTIVLASDGIHTLEPGEIARIVSGYQADGAAAIADALLRAVENQREPHQDNTTVIVVRALG